MQIVVIMVSVYVCLQKCEYAYTCVDVYLNTYLYGRICEYGYTSTNTRMYFFQLPELNLQLNLTKVNG